MAEDEKEAAIEGEEHPVVDAADAVDTRTEAEQHKFESDFALKMVDTLVSFNDQQISSYELPNRFFTKDELSCFGLFSKSVPLIPCQQSTLKTGFFCFGGFQFPSL